MKKVTVLLAVVAVVAWAGAAYSDVCNFNVPSGAWVNDGNWDTHAPDTDDTAYISGDRTATIGPGESAVCDKLYLGDGSWDKTSGNLIITGGSLTTSTNVESFLGYYSHKATITQDGGTVVFGGRVRTAICNDETLPFTYNLNGGSLTIASLRNGGFNGGPNSRTYFNQTGGSADIGSIEHGHGNLYLNISGGTFASRAIRMNGSGSVLHVIGSDADIHLYGYWHSVWGKRLIIAGTMKFDINAAGDDVTDITMNDQSYDNDKAVFEAGSILDMDLLGAAPAPGTEFLLITAPDGIEDNGLTLSPEDVGTWEIIMTETTLSAKYLPEPATLVLLGLGGCLVLLRRKK